MAAVPKKVLILDQIFCDMKKLFIVLAGLSLMTACKDDPAQPAQLSIEGVWKPIKMVETSVTANTNTPASITYNYDTCQQESRWKFNSDKSGRATMHDEVNLQCIVKSDQNFTYTYTPDTGDLHLQYITFDDHAKVTDVKENSFNLKLEENSPNLYHSRVYTMVRVQ